jgi:hypothetical protein
LRSKLKYLFLILLGDIHTIDSQKNDQSDKHPLVQYFHKCVAGDITAENIHEVTQLILSFDFGTTLIEHQQHLVNGKVIISYTL